MNKNSKNKMVLALVAVCLVGAVACLIARIVAYLAVRRFSAAKRISDPREPSFSGGKDKTVIPHKRGFYERYVKRQLDLICALAAMILLFPLMLMVAFLVRINLGSPVIFTQERPGLNARIFKIYKFRTMTDAVDANGRLLPDEERLTRFGRWLRSTSMDELPELFNILRGDMSFVGPRPLPVVYLSRYNSFQARRHEVVPGLTGLAQVHGRNSISWDEKFDWDVKYVNHISFLGDLTILLKTVPIVLERAGINASKDTTMPTFMGSGNNE